MKILPVDLENDIISECWINNKTSIIASAINYDLWISYMFNIYADENLNVFFGERFKQYDLSHFGDALVFSDITEEINRNNIVEKITSEIELGNYVYIDSDMSILFSTEQSDDRDFKLHELLILGYNNDKSVFVIPKFDLSSGKMTLYEISYKSLIKSYISVTEFYQRNPNERLLRSWKYNFPVTSVKCKKQIEVYNYQYRALERLSSEACGYIAWINQYNDNKESTASIKRYYGICALIAIIEKIDFILDGSIGTTTANWLTISLKKLHENARLVYSCMRNLRDIPIVESLKELNSQISLYSKYVSKMEFCYLLSMKNDVNYSQSNLDKIKATLNECYTIGHQCITRYIEIYKNVLISTYSSDCMQVGTKDQQNELK